MSDYLDRIPDEGEPKFPEKDPAAEAYEHYVAEQFEKYVEENTKVKCCGDAEYCVQASCVVCPECGCTDTIRTKEPDENNVSEFECLECECFFTAINP